MNTREVLLVRNLGRCDYEPTWHAMQSFTVERGPDTPDELWLLEHPPIYTLGQAGRPEHVLDAGDIPVVTTDRGGQVTYHGPGQVVVYLLLDLSRAELGVKRLVRLLEQSVIELLAVYGIRSSARPDAPGVYVDGAKIASIGLRVRRGRSLHGLALNTNMDLGPFSRINPCGYPGLAVTQIRDLARPVEVKQVGDDLAVQVARLLGRRLRLTDERHPASGATRPLPARGA